MNKNFSKLFVDFVIFKHEYKQERTTVKIINTIIVLFLFLKIYAIAFFSILSTSYLQIFCLKKDMTKLFYNISHIFYFLLKNVDSPCNYIIFFDFCQLIQQKVALDFCCVTIDVKHFYTKKVIQVV